MNYCIYRTQHWNDKFIKYYIEKHDKNGDGKLTKNEADKKNFVEIDKNHDGFLTLSELNLDWRGIDKKYVVTPPPTAQERRARRIKSIKNEIRFCDTDKDGRISIKEGMSNRCDSMTREEFTKYDVDNDGYITVEDRLNPRQKGFSSLTPADAVAVGGIKLHVPFEQKEEADKIIDKFYENLKEESILKCSNCGSTKLKHDYIEHIKYGVINLISAFAGANASHGVLYYKQCLDCGNKS